MTTPTCEPTQNGQGCCCKKPEQRPRPSFNNTTYFSLLAPLALARWGAYSPTIPFSQWVTYSLFGLAKGTHAADALEFFLYDTAKILLLLVAMVYAIAWVRISLSVEKVRDFLTGKKRVIGYLMGSGFGAITPFCSCSSIPLFMGFTAARIPLGITMAFLITSPLINEVAIVILWGLLGWKFTVVYVAVGMFAGIVGGFFMDRMKAERWLQPFLLQNANMPVQQVVTEGAPAPKHTVAQRHAFAFAETRDIFKRVWVWVIIGVAVGAALHGYVPQEWITGTLGQGQWWSVPLAVSVGIPLYTNVTGIIPVMESLLMKGLPLGTTLALCMSTIAVSLPEILMLKQVMRWQLLALFVAMMLVIFTLVGWFFNALNFTLL